MTDLSGRVDALESAYNHLLQQLLLRPDLTAASTQATSNTNQFETLYDSRDEFQRRIAILENKYINHSIEISTLRAQAATGVVSGLFVTGQRFYNNVYLSGLGGFQVSGSNRSIFFNPGTLSKSFTIVGPQINDDFTIMYTDRSYYVQNIYSVVDGPSSPSVGWNLYIDTVRDSTGLALVQGGITTTNITTGQVVPTINITTIPSGYFLWVTVTGVGGTINELFSRITLNS